ncbi:MAG: hypothetical protein H6741_26000 [Alphaproteobacteria bacterium]|nr:hypothetical protein [Alphaproteobacteria bacterium]
MLLLAWSLACRPAAPPEDPLPPPPPPVEPGPPGDPVGPPTPPPPPPPEPGLEVVGVTGAYSSASCHDRAYERRITLNENFTYSGQDLVSPCPPDVTCIWSGIVNFSGTWAQEAGDILLTEADAPNGDKAMARPKRLTWTDGLLTEPHPDGDCVYKLVVPADKPTQGPL